MTELKGPIRDLLRDPTDEPAIARMLEGVQRERAGAQARVQTRLAWSVAAAAVMVAVVLGIRGREAVVVPAPVQQATAPGPLHVRGGAPLATLDATTELAVELEEGSSVWGGAGGRLVTLVNDGREVRLLLERGRWIFDVRSSPHRRWVIECGLAQVEVVGTRFTIDRSAGEVTVSVERGVVLIKSELLEDRVRRLGAGESATARRPPEVVASPPTTDAPPRVAVRPPATSAHPPAEVETPGPAELFERADEARRLGHTAEALEFFAQVVDRFPADPRAALASFTIGRIELDELDRPARAAPAFTTAIRLGISAALEEDAMVRIVESHARSHHLEAAQRAAEAYRIRFPGGRRASEVDSWARPK